MDYYSNNKFLNEDVYKITQFLRGELYILVDFIMASSRIGLDIMIILNFLTRVITFFVDYLDILPLYLPEVEFFFFFKIKSFSILRENR